MMANSRAKTNREPDGFVKVIADAKTDRVLGVWCIASNRRHDDRRGRAGDGIRRDIEDIAYTCHAHPTHAEASRKPRWR
jgi:dihydrolipoamide dehydrogenase